MNEICKGSEPTKKQTKYCLNSKSRVNIQRILRCLLMDIQSVNVLNQEKQQFTWMDGPFLLALKQGHWIILDEINLASQSVLEGLN